MPSSRRSILSFATFGLAALITPALAAPPETPSLSDDDVAQLVRLNADANAALMRGDIDAYMRMVALADDFALMSPFGGTPTISGDYTPEQLEAIGRYFRNGTFEQELVRSWRAPGMVVLATIERAHVEVGGLPAQDWWLRVTLVYRREGSRWRLAHRHADPLARGISVEQAAALTREPPPE